MTTTVFLTETRLCLKTPYLLKDVCKSIPGARWDAQLKCWTYPRTPGAAHSICCAFLPTQLVWQGDAELLRQTAEEMRQAHATKTAEELPEIPLTKGPTPWRHQTRAFWFVVGLLGGLPDADDRR
jgi:hypothetical protein